MKHRYRGITVILWYYLSILPYSVTAHARLRYFGTGYDMQQQESLANTKVSAR